LTEPEDTSPLHANLIKSDGSTLYLTRYVVTIMMMILLTDAVTISGSDVPDVQFQLARYPPVSTVRFRIQPKC